MKTRRTQIVSLGAFAGIGLALTIPPAQASKVAGPLGRTVLQAAARETPSALAADHWAAIAAGDLSGVMGGYGSSPILHWDGGAFDGDHVGGPDIQNVWSRFARARAPLQVRVSDLHERGGAGGSRIVTADVVFRNHEWTYPVIYRLVFRQGRIAEETWHIADAEDGPAQSTPP